MYKQANLGDIFEYNGELVKCIGINTGHKSIMFEPLHNPACKTCGRSTQHEVIESCHNFQEGAKPIKTISTE